MIMDAVIYKYPLKLFGETDLEMPSNAQFIHAECQGDIPMVWFKHNPSMCLYEKRTFLLLGTGQVFDSSDKKFLKTFMQGPFVWHLHEKAGGE